MFFSQSLCKQRIVIGNGGHVSTKFLTVVSPTGVSEGPQEYVMVLLAECRSETKTDSPWLSSKKEGWKERINPKRCFKDRERAMEWEWEYVCMYVGSVQTA